MAGSRQTERQRDRQTDRQHCTREHVTVTALVSTSMLAAQLVKVKLGQAVNNKKSLQASGAT